MMLLVAKSHFPLFWKGLRFVIITLLILEMKAAMSSPADTREQSKTVCQCMPNKNGDNGKKCVNGTEVCPLPDMSYKRSHCYAAWKNESGKVAMQTMGCWLDHEPCYDKPTCEDQEVHHKNEVYFCCCEGSFCNANPVYKPVKQDFVSPSVTPAGPVPVGGNPLIMTILYTLVPLCALLVVVVIAFYCWRRHKMAYHDPVPTQDPACTSEIPDTFLVDKNVRPLQLLEVKAHGRFGCVWKAQMQDKVVAVKVFPIQDKQSFNTENSFYSLPLINDHQNILNFIGAERRGDNINMELWLISEFHENGSLYDYLKGHSITWIELFHIAEGMVRGLAFIHEAIPGSKVSQYKPAVAHRDFKSKNVLLKLDLTACVADFGLALQFEPGSAVGDTHGQVGTRRYMAPEVLEGAISFNRDAFLRIDMYACGLVLWELISRCDVTGPVEEYKLPFEEEAGPYPTLEDMQDVVVHKKLRPAMKDEWLNHSVLESYCRTIDECWDHDPEARLSAGCIEERISQFAQTMAASNTTTTTEPTSQQLPVALPTSQQTLSTHTAVTEVSIDSSVYVRMSDESSEAADTPPKEPIA